MKIGVPTRVCQKISLIMRLTTVILLTTLLQVSAAGFAQKITLNKSNAELRNVLRQLRTQSGYDFIYTDILLNKAKPVDINIKQATLEEALAIIFEDQPLMFTIDKKTVVIKNKEKSFIDKVVGIFSAIDVRGRVVDASGAPLPGVSIHAEGQKAAAVTNNLGYFQMSGLDDNATLRFEFIGYKTKRYKVSDAKGEAMLIVLEMSENQLSEVVAVGYGSVKRKDLTGSIASVDVNEIKNTPFVAIDQALAGKAAGVNVIQSDGAPGGMARIRIRGGSSLIGGNDPLYIIDGVQLTIQNRYVQAGADLVSPTERLGNDAGYTEGGVGASFGRGLNTLAGLNINDIESIDILKDASATAIYGSRAANGVVIITTKKGKLNQKPILEVNYYTGVSKAITEKLLNADQYKGVMLEGARNLNAILAANNQTPNAISTAIAANVDYLGTANTNWLDLVTRTGITQNADVSIRGGGSGSRYYTSLAYNGQDGTLLGTDFNRISGKINLDNEITSKLRLITNIDYSFSKNNVTNGIYSSALFAPPTLEPFAADGSPANLQSPVYGISIHSGVQNPMALLQGKNTSRTTLILGSLSLEYDILKSLKFRSTASVNRSNYHQLNYIPSTVNISAGAEGAKASSGGVATQAESMGTDVFFENTLTWDKQFNNDNRLNLLIGTSWQKTNNESFSASGQGFPDDTYLNGLSSAALTLPSKASEAQSALLSYYIRANYAFKERYLLTFTARSDESSKFPKNNRVAFFPSFGVAWKANEESFLKSLEWLNELKFRASAGYTGSQNLGNNLFYTLYTPGSYASSNALIPTQLGNDQIKWETTLQKDAGLDFAILNSRIRGSVGYYTKNTSDLLMAYGVAGSTGYTSALVNVASMSNSGLEIDLRGDIIRNKNFNWNLAMNFSFNRSKVTKINRDLQNPNSTGGSGYLEIGNTILREGESVGLIYGYQYDGSIKTQAELDEYKQKFLFARYGIIRNLALGYPRYKLFTEGPNEGMPIRDVIGNAQPKYYGGISNSFSYKNFSVIALLTYSVGGDLLYLPDVKSLGLGDRGNRNTRILLPHYTPQTPSEDRPSLVLTQSNTVLAGSSSLAVHDASYLKLKSISLNYQLPEKWSKIMGLNNAMVYASGSNLFIVSKYPGPDPEVSNDPYSLISGYTDSATYPSARQFTFGIRLGF